MRRLFLSVAVALSSLVVMTPMAGAQSRPGSRSGGGSRTESASHNSRNSFSRPGGSQGTRPGGSGNVRPGGGQTTKPGGAVATRPDHNNNVRPGGSGDVRPGGSQGTRPGSNSGNVRPGSGQTTRPGGAVKPGGPVYSEPPRKPGGVSRPVAPSAPRPMVGHPHRPGAAVARPPRPHYPYNRPFVRPVPPPGFRARYRTPLLSQFLGVTFGMTVANSVNILTRGGYSVTGYGNEEVLLRNVTEMGTQWADAVLHYASGALVRSTFYNSTSYDYTVTYNRVYAQLTSTYGAPVTSASSSEGMTASWFGYDGDYITLEYSLQDTPSGYRYFTVLTYGN